MTFIYDSFFFPYNHTARLGFESPQSAGFVIYSIIALSKGWRMFSRTAWLPWPCRRTWNLFHQTQREGCRRQTPCSRSPARLHEQTPRARIAQHAMNGNSFEWVSIIQLNIGSTTKKQKYLKPPTCLSNEIEKHKSSSLVSLTLSSSLPFMSGLTTL